MMKKFFMRMAPLLSMRSKKGRILNVSLLTGFMVYLLMLVHPNLMFANRFEQGNLVVHSTEAITTNMGAILNEADARLKTAEIYDSQVKAHIYLCNGYKLYTFFAPLSSSAFACNYPLTHNIFIANSNIEKNEAYKNAGDAYTRKLSQLITHETTHSHIERKLGYISYRRLSGWKNEGYCEYVAYGAALNLKEMQTYLQENRSNTNPGVMYKKYYIAVNYLMTQKNFSFDQLVSSDLSLEEVLKEVESIGS